MIIKSNSNLSDSSTQRKKLIPKHQSGGKTEEDKAKKMTDITSVVKPAHFVEGIKPDEAKRLYRVSDTGTGTLVSVPKNTVESIKGALLNRIKEQHNATTNKVNKEKLQRLMTLVTRSKPSDLRGNEEVDMFRSLDPDLSEFIEGVGFGAAAKKRGIDLSIPAKAVSTPDITASPLLTRLKQGGKISNENKKEDYVEDKKSKLVMKKGGKKWIQKATASIKRRGTEGKCTPITKPGCTGKAKALAKTFKKMAKKRKG